MLRGVDKSGSGIYNYVEFCRKGSKKMKIYCIGDSLTEGDYGVYKKRCIANVKEKGYPYFLSLLTGAQTVNAGKCGYTSTSYLKFYKNGNAPSEDVDIIIMMLGTNGGLDPDTETQGNADYEELLALCKKDAPSAEIVLCTPPHCTEDPEYSNCGYADRVRQAVTFVSRVAKKGGYRLIPLHECPSFTAQTEHIMQPNDGLHFSEEGYRAMAEFIADALGIKTK